MKIAFVTTYDSTDPTKWAGSTFHMARALRQQGIELFLIGPLHERRALYFKAMQFGYQKLLGLALHRDREPVILDGYAEQIEKQLHTMQVDLVFSPGTVALSHLQTALPIAFWSDSTYDGIVREYVWEPPACRRSLRHGHAQEAEALRRSALAIYTSEWAARSALEDYGTDSQKVKVVPFGANIDVHRTRDQVRRLIDARPLDRCRLLYIGVGWERKGGDIAVEVARRLNQHGLPTELTMLGSSAPANLKLPEFVNAIGFLDKRTEEGRRRFDELFGSSHFLILPARAEAFGVVLCEAASFGVPALAARVGGIPTIVRDDINGQLFDRKADPDHYVRYVIDVLRSGDRYRALAASSFDEYESRLNWSVSARKVTELLEQVVARTL